MLSLPPEFSMQLPQPMYPGQLIRRYQRFLADIKLDTGELITAYTPNTGSMLQCAVPGHRVLVSAHDDQKRKLKFTLELIRVGDHWVDTHTQRSNRLVEEALQQGWIQELSAYSIRREYTYGASRIDFLLAKGEQNVLLEVKNVTLCNHGTARFPDAVTLRGQKHLRELGSALNRGYRSIIFFLVQRGEAKCFSPADEIDPAYGKLLRQVVTAGVEPLAYRTLATPTENRIDVRIPVVL
jgi:sugar fermentation stimulation protein A